MVLIIIGIIGIIWFLLPFISYRIMNIGNITGIAVFLCLLILGVFKKKICSIIKAGMTKTYGKVIIFIIAGLVAALILTVIVESVFMVKAANRKPPENVTLVVLGCKVIGENPSLMLSERLEAAYEFLNDNPGVKCVVSGGKGADEGISEAECMYRYLVSRGIDKDRVFMEDKSTSTRENILFSKQIIEENGLNPEIAIVSNEFHLYRACEIARPLGIKSYTVPAKTAWHLFPTYYVRELYGILYQWIL